MSDNRNELLVKELYQKFSDKESTPITSNFKASLYH